MSLFQCENCGCAENTALSSQGFGWGFTDFFSWEGFEHLKGKNLCSACGPTHYAGGKPSGYGKWHNKFDRVFLPKGKFKTNHVGNLEHIETGETNFRLYQLDGEDGQN
ncbi:MAG: hypothetical protein ACRDBQ_23215 [Shewanella sp.]